MSLRLSSAVLAAVKDHARRAYPEECCGVLIGPIPADFDRPGRAAEALEARELGNVWEAASRGHRYQVDADLIRSIEKEFRGSGRGIVGWYHSHPDLPAWPSPFDLSRAWPCYSYLILSVSKDGVSQSRSWFRSADGADFLSEELVKKIETETPAVGGGFL